MSARNRRRACAYCGQQRKLTADHVPPKLFLERPLPPDLLTVPACADCNQSFKADDEYTRTVLATDIRASWNYAAQSNLPAIIRSLQRPNARGFAEYVSQQSRLMNVLAPSGSPVMTIQVDQERINRSGLHILRGLYFRETGQRLSGNSSAVRIGSKAGLTAEHSDMLTIARVFQVFPDQRAGASGSAFSYAVALADRRSVWIMLLYDYFFWCGSVDERDVSERDTDGADVADRSRVSFA
jgi:hypothetical protein